MPIGGALLESPWWRRRRTWPVLGRSKKIIIFLEALPAAPLSFSIVLQFPPALDPLPMSDNLELIF